MSPRLRVPRLQDYCLRHALSAVHDRLQSCKEDSKEQLHNQLIATLHSGIRQQLIDLAFIEYTRDANLMIDIVGLLMDSSVRSVEPKPESAFLNAAHCLKLFSIMNRHNATGLHELKIQVNPRQKTGVELGGLAPLHRLLSRGLAANLRTLVLRNACDNQVLAQLGRHALQLKQLDISFNWLIDETGIIQLLFKDPLYVSFPSDVDSCETWMLKDLSAIPETSLNRCCLTLQEVRIQDTNTSAISVLMLLMFIKNLESLGGFIYYRNLGDCILAVKPYRSRLALTKLWDMHLPWDKMQLIAEVVRHSLHTLYTRVSQLALPPSTCHRLPFDALRDLTVDFDFANEPRFVEFLAVNGAQLTRLVLIDQVFSIDVTVIANYCPLLNELAAKVCLDNHFPKSELAHLKCARLKVNSADTFRWIMVNCSTIRKLEIQMEQEEEWEIQGNFGMLNNKLIIELADLGIPAFDTIEHLSVTFMNNSVERLDSNCIWTLVGACSRLTRIEDVHTWGRTCGGVMAVDHHMAAQQQQQQYLNVAADLVEQNYDVDVRFKHISLTDFFRGGRSAGVGQQQQQQQYTTGILLAHAHW